jgi:hypothetical protein
VLRKSAFTVVVQVAGASDERHIRHHFIVLKALPSKRYAEVASLVRAGARDF